MRLHRAVDHDNGNPRNRVPLPLPIEDERALAGFCREWKIKRRDESGLSVVVPYVAQELNARRLLQVVSVHFFARILRNELNVIVSGDDLQEVVLDANSLKRACESIQWDGPKPRRFDAAINLEDTKMPGHAIVVLEAMCAGSSVISRFDFGRVDSIEPPTDRVLIAIQGENVFFALR